MADLPSIIQYFHDCYRSDNREQVIYDFLDQKIEDKIYTEGQEELLTNESPIIPIDSKKASSIIKKLKVFEKEKELLYGTFFVCGHYFDFKGDKKRLCSPLFYYPAEIKQKDEFHYLSIKAEERRINYPLVNLLSDNNDNDILSDPAFNQLPKNYIQFSDIASIVKVCNRYFPKLDIENIYSYPKSTPLKSIKSTISRLHKEDIDKTVLLPASMVGIVSKSSNTRGVLNELTELAGSKEFSIPLLSLFSQYENAQERSYAESELPMVLSEPQRAILRSASINPLTLIVGPPGTGKSYTIGAIAIEHMSRGESVLIASRTDEAVDVIVNKINGQLGVDKCVVRGGRKRSYSTPLKRFLRALLTRAKPLNYLIKLFSLPRNLSQSTLYQSIKDLSSTVNARKAKINKLESDFLEEVENEMQWGNHLRYNKEGLWNELKTQYLNLRNKFQKPIYEYSDQLYKADSKQTGDILKLIHLKYVAQVIDSLVHNWYDIKRFYEALKLSSDTDKINLFSEVNFKAIFKAFPIWATTMSDIKDVLPFEKELFDVVIIDEATQCDIASCLPLLQRAKRVVFAGDPNQLRHVSFLSGSIQHIFRDKYNLGHLDYTVLDYRNTSILDLVMNALRSGDQVAMLDEHFRSIPPIISFSNRHFYQDELRIMTARPDFQKQGLYFIRCDGKRNKKGANEKEADQLLADLRELINREKQLSTDICTSVGILSPFRGQVDLLAKLLIDSFSSVEIEKHSIRVGTAYSFQGEERDLMALSFTIDSESHHSAIHHINKEDVFNVSITRARHKQMIYFSLDTKDLKGETLLHSYLSNDAILETTDSQQYQEGHDAFLDEIKKLLSDWEINSHWPGYILAGLKIDLLLKHRDQYFGIDLVGYPGEFEDVFGLERYRILNRAGVKVFPLPYSDWFFKKEETTEALKTFINNQS